MDTQVSVTPLPAGTVIEGYTIEQGLESEPNVLRYSARGTNGDRVMLVELFPAETVTRDGVRVVLRNQDNQEGWQSWVRSFSERTRRLATLTHPGVVRLRNSFIANGSVYCVIDLMGGETLASVLEREETLSEGLLRQLLSSVISALEEAHNAGLLHGDLEPSRIRLQFDGKAILTGFATLVTPIRFKGHTKVNSGTPGYAPPEHLLVQAAEQPSSDIYSLAAIAYRAICGEAPPDARKRGAGVELKPSALAARGRYSAALTTAIDAGLAMRAQQRPQTLAEWRKLLKSEEAVTSGSPRPAQKKSSLLPWVAVPVVLAVLAGGYFLARNGKAPSPTADASVAPQRAVLEQAPMVGTSPPSTTMLSPPTLDQLAISMLKRGQRPVHQNPPETPAPANPLSQAAVGIALPASTPAAKPGPVTASSPVPATVAPQPAPMETVSKPAEGDAPAAAAVATAAAPAAPIASPAAASPGTDGLNEQQALQKAVGEEVAQQEEAAREEAATEAVSKQVAANETRDRIKRTVARAKAKCEIPAPTLSESENLVYENAMAVPGASRQRDGSVLLPEVTLGDGTTARFVIDSESCAHRVD